MKGLHMIAWILLIIGGLNWGLTALGWGLQNWISMGIMNVIFILVGLSALYELFTHKKNCMTCSAKNNMAKPMGQQM